MGSMGPMGPQPLALAPIFGRSLSWQPRCPNSGLSLTFLDATSAEVMQELAAPGAVQAAVEIQIGGIKKFEEHVRVGLLCSGSVCSVGRFLGS